MKLRSQSIRTNCRELIVRCVSLVIIRIKIKMHSADIPLRSVHHVPVVKKPRETAQASGGSGPSHERLRRRPSWAHRTDELPAIRPQGVAEVTWKHVQTSEHCSKYTYRYCQLQVHMDVLSTASTHVGTINLKYTCKYYQLPVHM